MVKIKCNVCSNEKNGFCVIKKDKMHINKKRKCAFYNYDASKLKVKYKIPSMRFGYTEQQNARQEAKKHLKELKELVKVSPGDGTAQNLGLFEADKSKDTKHPLTGDLSRFTTTATK